MLGDFISGLFTSLITGLLEIIVKMAVVIVILSALVLGGLGYFGFQYFNLW